MEAARCRPSGARNSRLARAMFESVWAPRLLSLHGIMAVSVRPSVPLHVVNYSIIQRNDVARYFTRHQQYQHGGRATYEVRAELALFKSRVIYAANIYVAARGKAWVCVRSLAGIAGSRSAGAWMSVSSECSVLSGRGPCVGLISRAEESYRVWCVCV
jgi:hypothetical protein